jgi:hypothetical protein
LTFTLLQNYFYSPFLTAIRTIPCFWTPYRLIAWHRHSFETSVSEDFPFHLDEISQVWKRRHQVPPQRRCQATCRRGQRQKTVIWTTVSLQCWKQALIVQLSRWMLVTVFWWRCISSQVVCRPLRWANYSGLLVERTASRDVSGLFANRLPQHPSILSEGLTWITKYVTPDTQTTGKRVHRINTEQNWRRKRYYFLTKTVKWSKA